MYIFTIQPSFFNEASFDFNRSKENKENHRFSLDNIELQKAKQTSPPPSLSLAAGPVDLFSQDSDSFQGQGQKHFKMYPLKVIF